MKAWSEQQLISEGYEIKNGRITDVFLNMKEHASLDLRICIEGNGWGVCLGGYKLGSGYLGAKEFKGSAAGTECIMRVMDTVGVSELMDMSGRYVRVATKGWGDVVKIFGNIVDDKWFDYGSFFSDKQES